MSYLQNNKFRLSSELYSSEILLNSIKEYTKFAIVKVLNIREDFFEILVEIKPEFQGKAILIKAELLNHILGSSSVFKLNRSE